MFFLAMDGTLNEPIYSYDRSAHRSHRKKAFKDEAEKIKEAIKNVVDSEETQKKKKGKKSKNLNEIDDDDF